MILPALVAGVVVWILTKNVLYAWGAAAIAALLFGWDTDEKPRAELETPEDVARKLREKRRS